MALMKAFRGGETNLVSVPLHDGYVYFCTDTKNLFFDHKDTTSTVIRSQINGKYAEYLRYLKDGQYVELSAESINTDLANIKKQLEDGNKVYRGNVTVSADNTSEISIPFTVKDTSTLTVYYRGLMLTPAVHYTATTSKITLVGFTANAGEIFTFLGSSESGILLNTSADKVTFSDTTTDQSYSGCSTVQEALMKIPTLIKSKAGITHHYGTCATSASTSAKVVNITSSGFVLEKGVSVYIEFTYNNTSSSITLNVAGTGAKAVKVYGTTNVSPYMWAAGSIVQFTYNGTYWFLNQVTTATTSTYGITKLNNTTNSTATNLAATANAVKLAYDRGSEAYTKATQVENQIDSVNTEISTLKSSVSSTQTKIDSVLGTASDSSSKDTVYGAKAAAAAALPKSGGTMTGILYAQSNTSYTTRQVRNITLSTSKPSSSSGSNGDIWFVYK